MGKLSLRRSFLIAFSTLAMVAHGQRRFRISYDTTTAKMLMAERLNVAGAATIKNLYLPGAAGYFLQADANGHVVPASLPFIPSIEGLLSSIDAANTYQIKGDYLTNIPAQPWLSITGKPNFSAVATTGSYSDLIDRPAIPSIVGLLSLMEAESRYQAKGNYLTSVPAQSWISITGRPNFATVATSGSYLDLIDRPAIPSIAGLLSSIEAANTYQPKGNYLTSVPYQVKLWSRTALLSTVAIDVADTFSIATATATVNLPLPPGTTTARLKSVIPFRAGATASNAPHATVTGFTNNSVSVVVTQANVTTINLVGLVNLNLVPLITVPDPQNVKLIISYACY